MCFKKIQILSQKPKGLASGFTEKRQFAAKTDINSIFLGCQAQILDRSHIMDLYISFMGFKKNQISAQNTKVLAFGFTEKTPACVKNGPKLRIS
jgi:hypothetical protein